MDYLYDGGSEKRFDILIPIAIILIIAVIFLSQTTDLFCGVPAIGGLLCSTGSEARIAVIGDFESDGAVEDTLVTAPAVESFLQGKFASIYNIIYDPYRPADLEYMANELLSQYDMVILVGDRAYTRPVRDGIENYLEKGGNVLLVGDAAVLDPDDHAIKGWGKMGMPVYLKPHVETVDGDIQHYTAPGEFTLQMSTLQHPIMESFNRMIKIESEDFTPESCNSGLDFIEVNPDTGAKTIAFARMNQDSETEAEKSLPAIVEGKSTLGGKVVYFAFDPGCSVNMFISTVEYLSGKNISG